MESRQEDVRAQMEVARQLFNELISTAPLSKSALSDRAGWTRSHLYDILRGRADLKIVHVLAILEALDRPCSPFFEELARRYRRLEVAGMAPGWEAARGREARAPRGAEAPGGLSNLEATIRRIVRDELHQTSLGGEEEAFAAKVAALAGHRDIG